MSTFAVNASDDVISKLSNVMDSMAQEGEKKADTLQRIFEIAAQHADSETMKTGGVDVTALDAAQENIRSMFVAAVTGREQIVENCNAKIAEIREKKDQMENDLRGQIAAAKMDAEQAKANADDARKEAEASAQAAAKAVMEAKEAKQQAQAQVETARSEADTAKELAAEREKTVAQQAQQLTEAMEKVKSYDAIAKKLSAAENQANQLMEQLKQVQKDCDREIASEKEASARALADVKKDSETAMRELQAQMDRAISDTQKDAALAQEKAVQEATEKLRTAKDAEKETAVQEVRDRLEQQIRENARLQAKIEALQEQMKRGGE